MKQGMENGLNVIIRGGGVKKVLFNRDIEQLQMQSKINRKSPERVQKLIPDNKSRNLHLMLSKIDNFYKTHEVNRDLEIIGDSSRNNDSEDREGPSQLSISINKKLEKYKHILKNKKNELDNQNHFIVTHLSNNYRVVNGAIYNADMTEEERLQKIDKWKRQDRLIRADIALVTRRNYPPIPPGGGGGIVFTSCESVKSIPLSPYKK